MSAVEEEEEVGLKKLNIRSWSEKRQKHGHSLATSSRTGNSAGVVQGPNQNNFKSLNFVA